LGAVCQDREETICIKDESQGIMLTQEVEYYLLR